MGTGSVSLTVVRVVVASRRPDCSSWSGSARFHVLYSITPLVVGICRVDRIMVLDSIAIVMRAE